MAKTEELIEKKFGRENPFSVPEGYFAQLQKNVMDSLPEQEPKVIKMTPRRRFLLPAITVAASVCVAVCGISLWFNKTTQTIDQTSNVAISESSANTDADDYIMLDNEAIYSYMSRN